MQRRPWSRHELVVVFNLYCKLPFGQYHRQNREVVQLANLLGRTPSAVAMKLCNFASFDPTHQQRGVTGLGNASRADKAVWEEFNSDWNRYAVESERAYRELVGASVEDLPEVPTISGPDSTTRDIPTGPTEIQRIQNVRLGQAFFRSAILAAYGEQCCICLLPCKALLVASHIIPWAKREALRLDPRNGLCLCALHDRAFDRGLISVDNQICVLVSCQLDKYLPHGILDSGFIQFRGQPIRLPEKFQPDPIHLEYHRTTIYQEN
jgi:hypothetical protein